MLAGIRTVEGGSWCCRGTFTLAITLTRGAQLSARVGVGIAWGHHGELLQGAFRQDSGEVRRGLITLPCKLLATRATIRIEPFAGELTVIPHWKTKALRAARIATTALGHPHLAGTLHLRGNLQVGMGFGSSTSDVTAAIRAVLDAFDAKMATADIGRIAVESERATDPLMFDDMVLFAHREGVVIESFGSPLLPVAVLGFPLGIGAVDTLKHPPAHYNDDEIEQFGELLSRLRVGLLKKDFQEVAAVATESAHINQRFLPIPDFMRFREAGKAAGADGMQIAHSGNIGGLLFDPSDPDLERKILVADQGLSLLGVGKTWYYRDGSATAIPGSATEGRRKRFASR
jgi:uncharacterized protein involved in propanediol utilization